LAGRESVPNDNAGTGLAPRKDTLVPHSVSKTPVAPSSYKEGAPVDNPSSETFMQERAWEKKAAGQRATRKRS